ncbi:hypothetical protein P7K49_033653, partial [Saguinus oedipus]
PVAPATTTHSHWDLKSPRFLAAAIQAPSFFPASSGTFSSLLTGESYPSIRRIVPCTPQVPDKAGSLGPAAPAAHTGPFMVLTL